jgi:creatinine amidohydrolase/Fe(II)-dependent formamide hydrolase-like protein
MAVDYQTIIDNIDAAINKLVKTGAQSTTINGHGTNFYSLKELYDLKARYQTEVAKASRGSRRFGITPIRSGSAQ